MRHVLLLLTSAILFAAAAFSPRAAAAQTRQPEPATLKSQMEKIHKIYGVNFVYDSSIDLDIPYNGKPLPISAKNDKESLEECLTTLFAGTGIDYEIMKKYIVLTKAETRKKPKNYTIFIEEQHDTLEEAIITAIIESPVNSTQTGLERIDGSKFNRGFALLSSPDVLKTLQTLPGVASGMELTSGLYVHGGTGSDNLFLMDGVHLYSVGHLGGLFSSFNSDVIDNVDFYKSGFPARYGGRMSSVVDVNTRDGDFNDYKGVFSVGLIEGRFQMEGPIVKGKTSFNVGLRRSWLDVLTIPAFAIYNRVNDNAYAGSMNMRYAMTDFNGKVTHRFSDHNTLSLSLFAGQDVLRVISSNHITDWTDKGYYGSDEMGLRWGSLMGSLQWKNRISDTFSSDIVLYHVQSRSKVNVYGYFKSRNDDGSIDFMEDQDYHSSKIYDSGLKADFMWRPSDMHNIRFGAEAIWHVFSPERTTERRYTNSGYEPVESITSEGFLHHGAEPALYIEDEMLLTKWLSANLGLRYVMFLTDGKSYHRLEPRAAIRFKLGKLASLKMSYSDMNQFNHKLNASIPLDLPTSLWMPSTDVVSPMHSRQYSLGAYFNLPHNIRLDIEGYYKSMDNIREYTGRYTLYPPIEQWEEEYTSGQGRAYGMEIQTEWSDDKTWISAGYTLSWSERRFDEIHDDWFYDMFDNRHKINVSATRKLSKRTEIYAGWTFRSGNRMTLPSQILPIPDGYSDGYDYVEIYTSPNNVVLPAYHRLDIGFNFHKTTKRGNESIWNLSIYNAYCHMNALNGMVSTRYDENGNEVVGFMSEMSGLIPIVPTFSYTLKF